jgi:hypothetical protein
MEKNTKILLGVAAAGVVLYLILKSKSKSKSDTAVVDMSKILSNNVTLAGITSSKEDSELALRWMGNEGFKAFPNITNTSQGYANYLKLVALMNASDKRTFTEMLKKKLPIVQELSTTNLSIVDTNTFYEQIYPKIENLNIQLVKEGYIEKEQPTKDDYQILIEQANLLNPELKDYIEELKQKQATAPN